jgi:hypothetical protein
MRPPRISHPTVFRALSFATTKTSAVRISDRLELCIGISRNDQVDRWMWFRSIELPLHVIKLKECSCDRHRVNEFVIIASSHIKASISPTVDLIDFRSTHLLSSCQPKTRWNLLTIKKLLVKQFIKYRQCAVRPHDWSLRDISHMHSNIYNNANHLTKTQCENPFPQLGTRLVTTKPKRPSLMRRARFRVGNEVGIVWDSNWRLLETQCKLSEKRHVCYKSGNREERIQVLSHRLASSWREAKTLDRSSERTLHKFAKRGS